jgi:cytochrome c peroxidase
MGTTWPSIISKLSSDPALVADFQTAFGRPIDEAGVKESLGVFQRSLVTVNSRFDKFLRGDASALTAEERKGYELFKSYGCIACHQGANMGGNMFQTFGVMNNYFAERGNLTDADLGRFRTTGNDRDRHVFKVPSLRNIALTAPYLHDGSAQTLRDAVDVMFRYQLGRTAPDEDKAMIVQFLGTLTGEYEGAPLDKAR